MKKEVSLLEIEPLRSLTFWHIWALGVGAVIGDGIFLLLGQGIATAGPGAVAAYLVAGLFQMFLMVSLGELAVGMPHAGAMSVWVERFMGKWWGFLSGFTFAMGWVFAGGSVSLALGRITTWFFPQLNADVWTIAFAIIFITVFAVLNIMGTAIAARTQLYLVIGLTLVMALFAILGFRHINPANFSPLLPFGSKGFISAIPLGTYAYLGAVTLATAGGECKRPVDLPRALVWSSITFLVLYTAAQLVVTGVIPWKEITMESSPFTKAAEVIFGYAGAFVVNLAAWIAAATCILMGTIYATSRIFFAQAREGFLPSFFGYLHPKTRTPVWGIVVIWAASLALIMLGTVNPDLVYVELSMQLVLAWMVSWALATIAAILYRTRCRDEVARLAWKQPLFPLMPILGLGGIAMVTYSTFVGTPKSLLWGGIWMGLLYVLFRAFTGRTRGPAAAPARETEKGSC